MAIASKERQEKYRNNRIGAGDTRLCVWISKDCKDALLTITEHLDVTQEHFIERLFKQVASVLSSRQNTVS